MSSILWSPCLPAVIIAAAPWPPRAVLLHPAKTFPQGPGLPEAGPVWALTDTHSTVRPSWLSWPASSRAYPTSRGTWSGC